VTMRVVIFSEGEFAIFLMVVVVLFVAVAILVAVLRR